MNVGKAHGHSILCEYSTNLFKNYSTVTDKSATIWMEIFLRDDAAFWLLIMLLYTTVYGMGSNSEKSPL